MKCIYKVEFKNKVVYIGMATNFHKRISAHLIQGTVYNYIIKSKESADFLQLTTYVKNSEASKLETEFYNKYKNNGYTMLNKRKTGIINKLKEYTKEECIKESKKYNSLSEFSKNKYTMYIQIKQNGWFEEVCFDLIEKNSKMKKKYRYKLNKIKQKNKHLQKSQKII